MKTAVSSAIYVPTTTVRVTPAKPEQQSVASPAPAPELETPATGSGGAHENSSHHEEGGCRISLTLMHDCVLSEFPILGFVR